MMPKMMNRILYGFGVLSFVEGAEYEWAGIFETSEKHYMWTAQKVDGGYVDPGMKLVALPANSFTKAELDKLEPSGNTALTRTCKEVSAGGTIVPAENTCYQLKFDLNAWQSLYKVDASATPGIAFFAEHVPTEFENTAHYLKDSIGTDIEPLAELPEPKEEESLGSAGSAIGASVLVNLVTLTGLVLMIPGVGRLASTYELLFNGCLFGFAAGALLSCAFFLLLFEATHLVATGWKAEVDVLWRWGTMILAGMFVPAVIETAVSAAVTRSANGEGSADPEPATKDESKKADLKTRSRLIGAVLIGDFFHNLCDGFFLGAAFKGCGNAFGWGVAGATILHELPQELADFVVLTSPEVGLSKILAMVFNFVSGLSVLLGTLIILFVEIDDAYVGLLLAFGGGVYIHVGAVDCMPKMYNSELSLSQRLACFSSFVFGAVVIGLILIGHEHCVPGGGEHAHGGH